MSRTLRKAALILAAWMIAATLAPATARTEPTDCSAAVALLEEQNAKLSVELKGLRREIAALRADLDRPGMEEVFSGLGYILGLFGAAAFAAARRKG